MKITGNLNPKTGTEEEYTKVFRSVEQPKTIRNIQA